jgi:4-hydroxy-4-methyl-2-oxoglutarate aldolase
VINPPSTGLLDALGQLDTCSVANAIETFEVRLRNEGFTDGSVHCLFDDAPPVAGHAATARIRTSTPPPVGHVYKDRTDWWAYVATIPPPRFVVVQDIDERPGAGAFLGEVHASILRALECRA